MIAPQVHDLVCFHGSALVADAEPLPFWLQDTLHHWLWGTVRNGTVAEGFLAVGIRGSSRHHRWPAIIRQTDMLDWKRPQDIRVIHADVARRMVPAMQSLNAVELLWQHLPHCWGPFGSTAFELATGVYVLTETSDLDLIVRIAEPIDRSEAQQLWHSVQGLSARTDVRIETPRCGFSLNEYVREYGRHILLRYPFGVRLGADPWQVSQ
jgi:phosphoribosyl-dephospho-CoA transferase